MISVSSSLRISEDESRFLAYNLLKIVKSFYSFKELEEIFDIPSQNIWKYLALRAIPEKKTALEILEKFKERRLFEHVLKSTLIDESSSFKYLRNPGFLELLGFLTALVLKRYDERVDCTISMPDNYSSSIATLVASYINTPICLSSRSIAVKDPYILSLVRSTGYVDAFTIPRDCFSKEDKVLVVDSGIEDIEVLAALLNYLDRSYTKIVAIMFVSPGREAELSRLELKDKHIRILTPRSLIEVLHTILL